MLVTSSEHRYPDGIDLVKTRVPHPGELWAVLAIVAISLGAFLAVVL